MAAITKAMVMTLIYMFLPVAAQLTCVGDGEVVEVLLGDEDVLEAGMVGVNDDGVVRVAENDDVLAPVVLFF